MKPLLVIDGKPRLYRELMQYKESVRTSTCDGIVTHTIVPNSTWAEVWLRNGERLTLRGPAIRSVRPSGRIMYSWSSPVEAE